MICIAYLGQGIVEVSYYRRFLLDNLTLVDIWKTICMVLFL